MNNNNLNVVILAAGKGTRMKTELPKCAVKLKEVPFILHVLKTCKELGASKVVVVVGYKREVIKEVIENSIYRDFVSFAYQEEQLGTAHAVKVCKDALFGVEGTTIITCGDMPLVKKEQFEKLLSYHDAHHDKLTILSSIFQNPFGYGRIVRDEKNHVKAIVEEKEATDELREIKEINTGLYAVDTKSLFAALEKVDNNNSKGEYYLTDIVKIMHEDAIVDACIVDYDYHLTGINTKEQLEEVESLMDKE